MDYMNYKIPNHIAIILDGNGRWASDIGKPRSYGHLKGAENLKKISKYIFRKGIKVLSVFAFSTENFKRDKQEVDYLMNLFLTKFSSIAKYLEEEKVKVIFTGRKEPLSDEVYNEFKRIENCTKDNDRAILNICVNYGGQSEIVDAVNRIINDKVKKIDELSFNKYLYSNLPPIDFLIRTSGEYRISNFMLYQMAYAEFYFSKVYFPAFDENEFDKAIVEYTKRDRRFGGNKNETKSN